MVFSWKKRTPDDIALSFIENWNDVFYYKSNKLDLDIAENYRLCTSTNLSIENYDLYVIRLKSIVYDLEEEIALFEDVLYQLKVLMKNNDAAKPKDKITPVNMKILNEILQKISSNLINLKYYSKIRDIQKITEEDKRVEETIRNAMSSLPANANLLLDKTKDYEYLI